MKTTIHDVVGNDEHVVALMLFSFERDGRGWRENQTWVSHMSDGKATERGSSSGIR